ncbi:hypothetical protein WA026_000096 [Henosepilachna vigintioctopunctata]|uniref:Vesicle transport through interaction with t-SNAREs homolog 1A n=1 Tax=Henosepilachna vigintioctopunctata TaxID=420089 RepID=A0AAW1V420_9CUCU
MVTLFENYEQQYSVLTADITAQIGSLAASNTKDRRQLISNIEKHVEEAQELLEQMDLEVREVETSKKQRCKTKLECYRAELKRLTLEYIKARSIKQGALNYDSTDPDDFNDARISNDQKQKLIQNSERLERSGKKLEEGYRILVETEETGTQILQQLGEQRETIQRSRNRLRETDEEVSRASRIINTMIMRSLQQKFVLIVVGACLLIVFIFGMYLSFKK